jgi:DNA topoisomerase IB
MKQDPCLLHGLDFEREHVQALQPDNEFAKLIKYVDHLIELRRNTREEQADSFGAAAPSADLIKKQTRLNFEKTKNAISKMKLIAAMSNIKNEK